MQRLHIRQGLLLLIFLPALFALFDIDAAHAQEQEGGKRAGVPQGILDKPYIARIGGGTRVGGYMDHELLNRFDKDIDLTQSTFRQHRFIPFLYSEITDRLHMAAEIEFEYGGDVEKGGEIKVEYAAMDFLLREWLVFRGGIILSPLGYFNLVHDSPWNDLTERPLVDQQIIPTTLSESGMGFTGTLYPGEMSVVHYELYVVNGFTDALLADTDDNGRPDRVRIRSGRGNQRADNTRSKAVTGRLSWSPRLGVQLGASAHTGAYSETDNLSIFAGDLTLNRGPFQFLGEYAWARTSLDAFDLDPQAQHGFYAQGNYHIIADRLLQGSVFTLVARYDYVDFALSGDLDDAVQDRITLGVNFRPVEDTVFKLDWGFNWETPSGGARARQGSLLAFSVATYF